MRFSRALSAVATFAALSLSGVAEAKNVFPYNHPDLDWYTIETEHFFVHYPVSKRTAEEGNKHYLNDEWVARKVAKVADEMWQPMCEQFDYDLTDLAVFQLNAAASAFLPLEDREELADRITAGFDEA
jgi:hypothetical protein